MSELDVPEHWDQLDLHNHTYRSYDARNRLEDYERAHAAGRFDVLAITEHNRIDGARELADSASFPVIIGQEIDTTDGELIGLFLTEQLPRELTIAQAAVRIREQGGLVYLPHPFFGLLRHPLSAEARALLTRESLVDIVEAVNGGPFTGRSNQAALAWALEHDLPVAAGSDAHEPGDIGTCVCAVPPGPLTPEALPRRIRDGRILTRRRSTVAKLAAKARTRALLAAAALRGKPRERR